MFEIPKSMLAPYGPLWIGDNGLEWDCRFGERPTDEEIKEMINEEMRLAA